MPCYLQYNTVQRCKSTLLLHGTLDQFHNLFSSDKSINLQFCYNIVCKVNTETKKWQSSHVLGVYITWFFQVSIHISWLNQGYQGSTQTKKIFEKPMVSSDDVEPPLSSSLTEPQDWFDAVIWKFRFLLQNMLNFAFLTWKSHKQYL